MPKGDHPYLPHLPHVRAPSDITTGALQRTYLERSCVHACTLLYTRGYTIVYTRVYFSLLERRPEVGKSTPRKQTPRSKRMLPDYFALDL